MGKARRLFGGNGSRDSTESRGGIRNAVGINTFESTPLANQSRTTPSSTFLKKTGDSMTGTFGWGPTLSKALVSDILVLDGGSPNFIHRRTVVNVTPQSGTTDDLSNIDGGIFENEMLILIGTVGNTITIKHNAGGTGLALCPGNVDYVLSGDETAMLIQTDNTVGAKVWRIIGDAITTGGGGDDLGNHIATQDIELSGTFDIKDFSVLVMGGTEATGGAIRLINNVGINWRNAGGSANAGIKLDASDNLQFGADIELQSTFNVLNFSSLRMGGTEATGNAIRLINSTGISWRDSGNTADYSLNLNSDNQFEFASNTVTDIKVLRRESTPATGTIGILSYETDNSLNVDTTFFSVEVQADNITDAAEDSNVIWKVRSSGSLTRMMEWDANGLEVVTSASDKLGFHGASPAVQFVSTNTTPTADATYSSNEQAMINDLWDMAVEKGLIDETP